MKRLFTYILCSNATLVAFAESPRAFLKAEYEAMSKTLNTRTGDTIIYNRDFVLRIGHGQSFYFDPLTNRIDSLENDPQGKIMLQQADAAASSRRLPIWRPEEAIHGLISAKRWGLTVAAVIRTLRTSTREPL